MDLAHPEFVWSNELRRQLMYRGNLLNAKNRNCCAWFSEKDLLKNENGHKGGELRWKNNLDMDYCG